MFKGFNNIMFWKVSSDWLYDYKITFLDTVFYLKTLEKIAGREFIYFKWTTNNSLEYSEVGPQ